ncbi:uncharacterized protein LOC142168913 [Nicotiana tabacum]|uniref:Uncharacterized protein LOC142168913 n=1 Tax=Nicotiana tabacum TaxID=4097 RepID=A0AC58SMK0_TOBAC
MWLASKLRNLRLGLLFNVSIAMKPSPRTIKLNTDGCMKGNSGSAGRGEILRDDRGQLIMAFTAFFGVSSNNVAKVKAVLIGMQWCIDKGYLNAVVESDTIIIIEMSNEIFKPSWKIKYIIRKIRELMTHDNLLFQ